MQDNNNNEQLDMFGNSTPLDNIPINEEKKPEPEPAEKDEQFCLFGKDIFGNPIEQAVNGALRQRYIAPPFTVLDARQGLWQDRKNAWLNCGIESEVGRGENLAYDLNDKWARGRRKLSPGGSPMPATAYNGQRGDGKGRELSNDTSGTSIFDPVLCEVIYNWFCPPAGQIVDPFAGGSVRGIIGGLLGFKYWGCDLSEQQVKANRLQAAKILTPELPAVKTAQEGAKPAAVGNDGQDAGIGVEWVVGDSLQTLKGCPAADLIFSCPPYGDLEVYSDDPRDLSNMTYEQFMESYKGIIKNAAAQLKNDRFACFVVGDFRDKKTGYYRGFVADTIMAFRAAGMALYNEAILITMVGSQPVRAGRPFNASRKLSKGHQNVLVFVKGDPVKATNIINKEAESNGKD